jgi:hypothetical protein
MRVSNKLTIWHVDLNGYAPLDQYWELIGSVGIGWVKPKVHVSIPTQRSSAASTSGFFAGDAVALSTLHGKHKAIFRLGIGAQYTTESCVGIRGLFRWETTSSARVDGNFASRHPASNINFGNVKKMFRDTYSLALGIFFKF